MLAGLYSDFIDTHLDIIPNKFPIALSFEFHYTRPAEFVSLRRGHFLPSSWFQSIDTCSGVAPYSSFYLPSGGNLIACFSEKYLPDIINYP